METKSLHMSRTLAGGALSVHGHF